MDFFFTLIHTATISHLVLSGPFGLGNDGCFWSIQLESFAFLWVSISLNPWLSLVHVFLYLHNMFLQKLTHITSFLPLTYNFFPRLEIYCPNQLFLLRGSPQSFPWMYLVVSLTIFFSGIFSFRCCISYQKLLWFHWWLIYIGGLGGKWTPYDINNSLT